MKTQLVVAALAAIGLAPALMAQGTPITLRVPEAEKIKITGGTVYYAGSPYLSIRATLTRAGAPVLHAKVRLNDTLLREWGGGFYGGAFPTPYRIEIGHEHVFSVEFPAIPVSSRPFPPGRQVLATYRVDNLIRWLSPSPGQVLDLAAYPLGEIPCRWKFAGTPVRVRVCVVDRTTRAEILCRETDGGEFAIPTAALRPGNNYSLEITTAFPGCGPLGRFKLGKLAASGSDVHYDWDYYLHFSTAPAGK